MMPNNKRKINKVLFIVPPCALPAGRINVATPPLGIMYLAAVLEKEGYKIKIVDALLEGYYNGFRVNSRDIRHGLSYDAIKNEVARFSPDLVGISCQSSVQFLNTIDTCKAVRRVSKDIVITMGGPHSTVYPDKILEKYPEFDFIIMGEGEYSLRDLIRELNKQDSDFTKIDGLAYRDGGQIKINPKQRLIENLDELPFPARHMVSMEKYFKINFNQNLSFVPRSMSILSSRGCNLKCIFCFNKNYWLNRYRVRSPENIIAEIDHIQKEYKIRELQFSDDNLTADRKRAIRIFEMMKRKRYPFKWSTPNGLFVESLDDDLLRLMKQSGCYEIRIAIESGNEEVLHNIINKPIKLCKVEEVLRSARRCGLLTSAFISIGYPGETRQQIEETFAYVRRVRPGCVFLSIASPLPNTELMNLGIKEGMNISTDDFKDFEFSTPNTDTDKLSRNEIKALYIRNMFWLNIRLIVADPKAFFARWGALVLRHPLFSLMLVINHFKRLLLRDR